jgi:hypothetical protein
MKIQCPNCHYKEMRYRKNPSDIMDDLFDMMGWLSEGPIYECPNCHYTRSSPILTSLLSLHVWEGSLAPHNWLPNV